MSDLDIARAFVCPHWPYWERFGDPTLKQTANATRFAELFETLWNEDALIKNLAPDAQIATGDSDEDRAASTEALMAQGVEAIVHPVLIGEAATGSPTLLLRKPGHSRFGSWLYVPVDIRRGTHLRKDEAFRLFFYGDLLREIQNTEPSSLACMNRDGEVFFADPSLLLEEYHDFVSRLRRTIEGECPEPVYRKGCQDTSPWGRACLQLAADRDDIALLFSISQKQLTGLHAVGVHTVHQAAVMDPLALDGEASGLTLRGLLRLQKQATSLVEKTVIVREAWPTYQPHPHVYFDIESHPGTDEDYLYGFFIEQPDGSHTRLTVDRFDGKSERAFWEEFLAILPTLPPGYCVYHYGDYELTRLTQLAARYQTKNPWLDQFIDRLIDVKELVRDCLVLPLFFYSLKTVGGFLGFDRNEEIRHGRDSIYLYEHWLKTQDPTIANALTNYNMDDVEGLAQVVRWAERWAKTETSFAPPYPW